MTEQKNPSSLSPRDLLQIDRLFFSGLLVVAVGAVIQILQVTAECAAEDWVMRLFVLDLVFHSSTLCFENLDAPLTLSLVCFAVSIPGLAANIVTITLSIQLGDKEPKGTKLYPELRLPFAKLLARFFDIRIPENVEPKRGGKAIRGIRYLAIRIAQISGLLGVTLLFLHYHWLAALLFLTSATVTYVLVFSFFNEVAGGLGGEAEKGATTNAKTPEGRDS